MGSIFFNTLLWVRILKEAIYPSQGDTGSLILNGHKVKHLENGTLEGHSITLFREDSCSVANIGDLFSCQVVVLPG